MKQEKKKWAAPRLDVHGNVEEITKQIPTRGSGFVKNTGKGDDSLAQQMGTFSCVC